MRNIIIYIFIFIIAAAFHSQALSSQNYSLELLVESAPGNKAHESLQKAMEKITGKDFLECCKEAEISISKSKTYFAAVRISINTGKSDVYLVFPSKYCPTFFGAHSISFWILRHQNNGNYENLYSGKSDGIKILKTKTNDFNDIQSWYGDSFVTLKFDSQQNKYKGSGGKELDQTLIIDSNSR